MATDEDRAHAQRLLEIHRDNLRRLEEKKALYGLETPQAIENQIDQERANIAALEPITKPPPSQRIQDFVIQASAGDWAMMFSQFVLLNTRQTQTEEKVNQMVSQQSRTTVWQMKTDGRLEGIEQQQANTEQARKGGAKWYRIALLALFVLIALHYFGVW